MCAEERACTNTCIQEPEADTDVFFHLCPLCFLRQALLLDPEITGFARETGWRAPGILLSMLRLQPGAFLWVWLFKMWVLGIELRPSCFYGKHFTD